ncbi:acyltransferase family protein [Sphingomonas sp. DT-204]|uniref:acyltransferase family protein n=1 Tax=Sphingomonas sp. DT-204 TaxID=3396166 RepID=UPI003F1B8746
MASSSSAPSVNNLDLVRFVLASTVFISHAHDLSTLDQLSVLSSLFSSTMAVQAFFVISGFLIFQSYDRSSTLKSYASKRIRRIYPAYFVIVVTCAIFLGFMSKLPFGDYITNIGLWKYVAANLVFLNFLAPELPGVFQNNTIHAINGALWTLKIEVAFYIAVPICVWLFRKVGRMPVLVGIYLLSVLYAAIMLRLAESGHSGAFVELSRQLPGQMTYFIAGAAIYYYFDYFRGRTILMLASGLALLFLSTYMLELVLRPLGVALCVMGVAFGPYFGRFGRYGDFSYGIYIVHFPILQTMISLGFLQREPVAFVLVSTAVVLLAAMLMWHLVEKRFLRRDSHYRKEANANAHTTASADQVALGEAG